MAKPYVACFLRTISLSTSDMPGKQGIGNVILCKWSKKRFKNSSWQWSWLAWRYALHVCVQVQQSNLNSEAKRHITRSLDLQSCSTRNQTPYALPKKAFSGERWRSPKSAEVNLHVKGTAEAGMTPCSNSPYLGIQKGLILVDDIFIQKLPKSWNLDMRETWDRT